MYAFIGSTSMGPQAAPIAGITVIELDGITSRIIATTAAEAVNPMYLAASPDGRVAYAAHADASGYVTAWGIHDAHLSQIGTARSSGGDTPCHLTVHPSGRYLLTANYATGTIAVHPIRDDGSLAEASQVLAHTGRGPHQRQDGSHPHMIATDANGRDHVLAVDLGTDSIHRYHLALDTGRLTEDDQVCLPPGTGPRHLAIHDDYAYVVGELASTLTVIDLATSPPSVLTTIPTHVTGGDQPSYPSAIRLSPDGQLAYVLNRGPNTIATFSIDGPDTSLIHTAPAGGDYPWDTIVHNGHLYVANQRSSTLTLVTVSSDAKAALSVTAALEIPHPVCILPIA